MTYRALLAAGALHLLAWPLAGQQRLGASDSLLTRLTAEALAASPSLAGAAATARAAELRVRPAGALPDPLVTTGVGNLTLPGFAFRESDFTEAVVEVTQAFPWPGSLGARTRGATAAATARAATASVQRRDVVIRVAERYYRLRYLAAARVALERQRTLLDGAVEITTARYATGAVSQADPLQARIARSRLDAELLSLAAGETRLRAELAALRGVRGGERLDIEPIRLGDVTSLGRAPLEHDTAEATLARHPRVQAREAELVAATAVIDVERRAGRPDFELTARYGARPLGADFFSAFVGVRLPIWAGRKQHRLAEAAEADTVAARAAVTEELLALSAEATALHAEAVAGADRLRLLVDLVIPAAEATVDAALRGYRSGKGEFVTALLAQEALYRSQLEAADVAADHLTHLVMLDQLLSREAAP